MSDRTTTRGIPYPLDRGSDVPLWRQLRGVLEREVRAGAFPGRLPTEQELTSAYGVSRHTVREALRELRTAGVVERRRGFGTFVTSAPMEQRLSGFYSLARSAAEQGRSERSQVLSRRTVTHRRAAAALGVVANQPLAFIERLRYLDDEPLGIVRSWLPVEFGTDLAGSDLGEGSLYDALLARGVRVTDAWEHIRATLPTARQQRLLGIAGKLSAVLLVTRLAVAGETAVEWRETVLRGDRYVFAANLRNEAGDRPPSPQ